MVLVSAILPTRGRPEWARQAVDCFCAQTYPEKELIILDDMHDRSFPGGAQSLPTGYPILYFMDESRSIPQKRNRACELARGEIICHFDSDDYSEPERIADQVELLQSSGKALTGYYSILFYEASTGRWMRYVGTPEYYACGTSLCYLKSFWQDHRFKESEAIGEDNAMVKTARDLNQIISVDGSHMLVARVHPGNTSHKNVTTGNEFKSVSAGYIPKGFRA